MFCSVTETWSATNVSNCLLSFPSCLLTSCRDLVLNYLSFTSNDIDSTSKLIAMQILTNDPLLDGLEIAKSVGILVDFPTIELNLESSQYLLTNTY